MTGGSGRATRAPRSKERLASVPARRQLRDVMARGPRATATRTMACVPIRPRSRSNVACLHPQSPAREPVSCGSIRGTRASHMTYSHTSFSFSAVASMPLRARQRQPDRRPVHLSSSFSTTWWFDAARNGTSVRRR